MYLWHHENRIFNYMFKLSLCGSFFCLDNLLDESNPGRTSPMVNVTVHCFKRNTPVRFHSWSYHPEVRRASSRAQRHHCTQALIWRSDKNPCSTEVSGDHLGLRHSKKEEKFGTTMKSQLYDWAKQSGEKCLKSRLWVRWSPARQWETRLTRAAVLQQLGLGHWSRSRESCVEQST